MRLTSGKNKRKPLPRKKDEIWDSIFTKKNLHTHNFTNHSISLNSDEIRALTLEFKGSAKEPRILCRHITPTELPLMFRDRGLFCLPVKNKDYRIIQGNPFTKVPEIHSDIINAQQPNNFRPICYQIGDSEMQHLDYCFNSGVLNLFFNTDKPYFLTMRGRKYCKPFSFHVGEELLFVEGVQYETDGVYENEDEIIICEAKNNAVDFIHNRQFFYPYKDILRYANNKPIRFLLFCHHQGIFSLWEYAITNPLDFNSIRFIKSQQYTIENSAEY